jgi:hypothetical protein
LFQPSKSLPPGSTLFAFNPAQNVCVTDGLKTGRIMAKDEDVCLHCGLDAECCPTAVRHAQILVQRHQSEVKFGCNGKG